MRIIGEQERERAGEAARSDGEPRHGLGGGVHGPDGKNMESPAMGVEGVPDAIVSRRKTLDVDLRVERPDAAPAARENAGPTSGQGTDASEDEDQHVVRESAEAVLAAIRDAAAQLRDDLGRSWRLNKVSLRIAPVRSIVTWRCIITGFDYSVFNV